MPVFAFRGLDGGGKPKHGVREADSPRVLRQLLRREGIFVTDVSEKDERVVSGAGLHREVNLKGMFDRVRPRDVAILTRQLATLTRAGIPLSECLSALVEQATSPSLQRVLAEVRTKVNEGTSLADALGEHPKVFSELYVNMVRAGEASGSLDRVLARLTEFLESQAKLKNKVTSALVYPAVMAVVSILLVALLMIGVVPQVKEMFDDMGETLPWYTRLLMFTSDVMSSLWGLLLASVIGGLFYLFLRWKRSPKGKPVWDRLLLRLWIVGPLVKGVGISRFARTLATLLQSGVQLLNGLEIVKRLLGNHVLEATVEDVRVAIREGESMAGQLAKSGYFPPMVSRMIAVGERSGELEAMLENVAEAYENEVEIKIGRLMSLMEPLLIVVMGGSVGFIVFSILMPIMQMNNMIG